jgi:LmbE family N-acetylglucosaminyl deacetylase
MGTVLHVGPHPDDELIGAPAALMALRDAGWRVVDLACSLGRADERDRRLAELRAASARAGFTLEVVADPPEDGLSRGDLAAMQGALEAEVAAALERHRPALVVAPSPHDRHPGHEVVGRAVLAAGATLADSGDPAVPLWLWGVWADLPFPTLAVAFDDRRLAEIVDALSCHRGELDRNDYRRLLRGRAEMQASLGPERVFGFGASATEAGYVELLCEVVRRKGRWHLGRPRWLTTDDPLGAGAGAGAETGTDVTEWLTEASLTVRFGAPGPSG